MAASRLTRNSKKRKSQILPKKCFVGQAYAAGRDSFISYVTYSPAAAIIRWINWKCLSIKRKSFEKILKFLTVDGGGDKPPDWIGKLYNALGTTWSMEVLKTLSELLYKIANNPKCLKIRNTNPVKFNQSKIGTNCAPNTLLGLGY